MSRITVNQLKELMQREFPQSKCVLEEISDCRSRVSLEVGFEDQRPGGTISGLTMMGLADMAMYMALLGEIGPVVLAVTTNLNIHFVRKPKPYRKLIGECRIIKLGEKLAVGEVQIFSEGISDMVALATCTYSIPPFKV